MPRSAIDMGTYRDLAALVKNRTGIILEDSRSYLVETRLGPLLEELDVDSFLELSRRARIDRRVLNRLIDAISTNETSFFRDRSPFELLKYRLLPDLMDRKSAGDVINIWSAAASTGQEVYSIAIACREILGSEAVKRVRILGTDISSDAVQRASAGHYSPIELGRGLSAQYRTRYFRAQSGGWKISDELRAMASFRQMNLLDPLNSMGRFDIIFCRNVAIYFDAASRRRLFEGLARHLEPGGALIIGSSETMVGVTNTFERREHMRCAYYVPVNQRAARS